MKKVIFKEEYNSYTEESGYLAVFPEEQPNPGFVLTRSFVLRDGEWHFAPPCDARIEYVKSQKTIHKDDDRIPKLIGAIEKLVGDDIEVVERLQTNVK